MNRGSVIFAGVFFALLLSWFGLVVQPQRQLGNAQPSPHLYDPDETHPSPRSGLAQRGLQVYRSLGCAACHTQQIQQQGVLFDVILAAPGTNVADLIQVILDLRPDLTAPEAGLLVERLPVPVLENVDDLERVQVAAAKLSTGNARVETRLVPVGPDIARGWGVARSVGADFLYDYPVMLGSQRIGPDLANVGAWPRSPDWHLQHLYKPTSLVPGSVMPPFRFLFDRRPASLIPAPGRALPRRADLQDAIIAGARTNWVIPDRIELEDVADLESDYEIVPTEDARALVAYLMSLRADSSILERPLTAGLIELDRQSRLGDRHWASIRSDQAR